MTSGGDEAGFRRRFVRVLRSVVSVCEYMSSMNRAGVPDLFVIADVGGRACWMELKYVGKWPARDSSGVLTHRFSGPQLAFLGRVSVSGGLGLGVIGHRRDLVTLLSVSDIDDDGGGTVTAGDMSRHLTLDMSETDFRDRLATALSRM